MAVRKSGVLLPFDGNNKELASLVNFWFNTLNINPNSDIDLEWLTGKVFFIHSNELSSSAFKDSFEWGDLLVRSLGIDWLIIFDFSDTNASYSYIIYENGLEIRCVIQEEESEFYMDGHIQGFEKELLDFSTRYLHEYKENGKAQKQWITDLEFSLLNTKDDNTGEYYKYYYLNVSGKLIYHTHLARLLLIELFITYIGFEIFDSNYIPYSLFKIRFKNEPNYEIYLKLALTGDTSAQNKIGEMFEKGLGVEKNYEVAQEWFQKSSDQDDDVGMLNLGLLLLKNEGDNNIVVATDLIKKSVEKGNFKHKQYLLKCMSRVFY